MITPPSSVSFISRERLLKLPVILGWIGFVVLTACAAGQRFRIAPIAVSEWDSWGWLNPALGWLGGAGFREQFEREWLYGAFIAFCLRLTGSFSGYIIVQQVLGLLAGGFMWLTWRRWVTLFPENLLFEIVSVVAGLLVVAVYLFSPIALALELSIRPEGIMALVAFLQLYCVTSYCKFRWHEPRSVASGIFGALAILLAYSLFVLKPNWLLAAVATTLPVFLGVFGRTSLSLAARLLPPSLGVLLILLTLVLPEKIFFIRTAQTRLVLPMTLFTIHADVIHQDMRRQLSSAQIPEERRRFLLTFLPILEREMDVARTLARYYPRLGFDPDYLMYRAGLFPFLESTCAMSRQEIANFCRTTFLSAIWNQPSAYARKVFTQLGYFFFPDDGTFFRKSIPLGKLYDYVLTTVPESLDVTLSKETRDLYETYHREVVRRAGEPGSLDVWRAFIGPLRAIGGAAFYLEIAFLLSLAACLAFSSLACLRLPGLVALIFFLAPAGNAVTIALIHALDNSRYRGSYGPILLFALAALCLFAFTTFAHAARIISRRHRA